MTNGNIFIPSHFLFLPGDTEISYVKLKLILVKRRWHRLHKLFDLILKDFEVNVLVTTSSF